MNRSGSTLSVMIFVLGVSGGLTGAFAFVAPAAFFETFAAYTGTLNPHLMRDVGAAYLTAGGALTWAAFNHKWRAPLTATAAAFLGLHAVAHIFDLVSGEVPLAHLLADLVQVLLPAAAVCGLAIYFIRGDSTA